jgi:hypothetical protein
VVPRAFWKRVKRKRRHSIDRDEALRAAAPLERLLPVQRQLRQVHPIALSSCPRVTAVTVAVIDDTEQPPWAEHIHVAVDAPCASRNDKTLKGRRLSTIRTGKTNSSDVARHRTPHPIRVMALRTMIRNSRVSCREREIADSLYKYVAMDRNMTRDFIELCQPLDRLVHSNGQGRKVLVVGLARTHAKHSFPVAWNDCPV